MNNHTPEQNQELRHEVLNVLAQRHPTALSTKQIHHRAAMSVDFAISEESVHAALEFQKGLNHVSLVPDAFGSTKYWTATSAGVLAWERKIS